MTLNWIHIRKTTNERLSLAYKVGSALEITNVTKARLKASLKTIQIFIFIRALLNIDFWGFCAFEGIFR